MDANKMQEQAQAHAEHVEEAITQAAKVVSATVAPIVEKVTTSDSTTDRFSFDYQPYLNHVYDAYENLGPYAEQVSNQVYSGYVSAAGEFNKLVETSTEQARLFADHIELENNLNLAKANAYKAYDHTYNAAIHSSEVADEYLISTRAKLSEFDHVVPLGFLPVEHERYEPLVLAGGVIMVLTIFTWAIRGKATPPQVVTPVEGTEEVAADATDDAMPTPMSPEEAAERLAADKSMLNMSLNQSAMNQSLNASNMLDISMHENKENSFVRPAKSANVSMMNRSNNTSLLSKSNNTSMMEQSLPLGVKSGDTSFHNNNNNRSQLDESFVAKNNNTSFAAGSKSTNTSMMENDLDTSRALNVSAANIGQTA